MSGGARRTAFGLLVMGGTLGWLIGTQSPAARSAPDLSRTPQASATVAASAALGNPNIFVELSKKVVPSVVNISTTVAVKGQMNGPGGRGGNPEDMFRQFFDEFFRRQGRGGQGDEGGDEDAPRGAPGPGTGPKAMSLGSGFIIDASGLIMTNNHVVADADEIKIYFTEEADEKPSDGEVVGRDPELDLALIRVKSKRTLVPAALGDSDALEVGEYVMAVGNPFGQGHSVTHGIISAKERKAPDFLLANYLQTDAPINPGNSGGPLINLKGEVIGINNAIDARANGIGFAIPISLVKKVLPQLKTKGTVSRGYIGVLVGELTPEIAGKLGVKAELRAPFVSHVYPGEPADKAGLKPYDVILEFNGKPLHSGGDLINAVTSVAVGQSANVKISRAGGEKTLTVKVAERPSAEKTAQSDKKADKKRGKAPIDTGMDLESVDAELARRLGVPEKSGGVIVDEIDAGGPADRAGIARDDIIVEVDRKPIKDLDAFYAIVKEKKSYLLRVRRFDADARETFSIIVLDLK